MEALPHISRSRMRLERRQRLWSHRLVLSREALLQFAPNCRPPSLARERVQYIVIPVGGLAQAQQVRDVSARSFTPDSEEVGHSSITPADLLLICAALVLGSDRELLPGM
jgi:hypothetical protein